MKKVVFADQLGLSQEIISKLTEEQLQEIEGGVGADSDGSCTSGNGSCVIIVVTNDTGVDGTPNEG
jgi:bacteriocin-like protein